MSKIILVTGAEGFIGSHLTEALILKGYKVKALVLYNFNNSYGWISDLERKYNKKIEIVTGDVRDLNFLINLTRNVELIFHLAALISIPYSYKSPKSYLDTNVIGTYNILETARINKIKKIIITSTSEVYGTAQFVPIKENHSLNAQSPYAASKIGADQLALSYFRSFDLPVIILRPFNTFGPRQSNRAIIPTIVTQALRNNGVINLGSLNTKRDFTFVKDTVSAFICTLKRNNIYGEVINIGNNFEISIEKILKIMKNDFGFNFKIHMDKSRVRPKDSEVMRLLASNKKAKKLLNWKPSYEYLNGFKKALKETIDWYRVPENLKKFNTDIYNI